jgi:hypothetical protein
VVSNKLTTFGARIFGSPEVRDAQIAIVGGHPPSVRKFLGRAAQFALEGISRGEVCVGQPKFGVGATRFFEPDDCLVDAR